MQSWNILINTGTMYAPFRGPSFLTWRVRGPAARRQIITRRAHLGSLFILALKVVCSTVGALVSRHLAAIAYLTPSGTVTRFRKSNHTPN
jgi:hypothetical protein